MSLANRIAAQRESGSPTPQPRRHARTADPNHALLRAHASRRSVLDERRASVARASAETCNQHSASVPSQRFVASGAEE